LCWLTLHCHVPPPPSQPGARVLSESLSLYDTAQRYRLACQLPQLVKEGVKLAPGEWPEQLLQQRDRWAAYRPRPGA
jgi:hypothetical protein